MRLRTIAGALAVSALAVGGLAGCGSPQAQAGLVGYRAPDGTDQLVLVVETGPNDTLLDGKVLSEDADAVTVEVPMRRAEDDQPAQAVQHDVTVTLAKPLGARKVLAASGNPVPQLTTGS